MEKLETTEDIQGQVEAKMAELIVYMEIQNKKEINFTIASLFLLSLNAVIDLYALNFGNGNHLHSFALGIVTTISLFFINKLIDKIKEKNSFKRMK